MSLRCNRAGSGGKGEKAVARQRVALKLTQNGNENDETDVVKLTHAMTGNCKSKLATDRDRDRMR